MKYRLSNAGGDGNTVAVTHNLTKEQAAFLHKLFAKLNDAPCDSIWKPFLHMMTDAAHQAEKKRMKRAADKANREWKKKEEAKKAAAKLEARKEEIGC